MAANLPRLPGAARESVRRSAFNWLAHWRQVPDPIVHIACWDEHKAEMEPIMAARRMREGNFEGRLT